MRVLYVNQVAQMSGAEHSLLTLIAGLRDRVDPILACPSGDLADAARDRGIPVSRIEGTDVSLALHPIDTPLSIAKIAIDGARVARIARAERVDLIHANTTRAGLIATMFAGLGAPPTVVHVRDWSPNREAARVILRYARARATALICISEFVADEFRRLGASAGLHVVYNPIDGARFDPSRVDRASARASLGLGDDALAVGIVGQLTVWKGQSEAIRAFASVAGRFPHARLLIAGSAKFQAARLDNAAYEAQLRALPAELDIADRVTFLGERRDIPEILRALDILLVPSWKEAFGRIVVEGMAMGLPVVATDVGGPREIITPTIDGLLAPPHEPAAWSDALAELLGSRPLRVQLGRAGRQTALERFSPADAASAVATVYDTLLAR